MTTLLASNIQVKNTVIAASCFIVEDEIKTELSIEKIEKNMSQVFLCRKLGSN